MSFRIGYTWWMFPSFNKQRLQMWCNKCSRIVEFKIWYHKSEKKIRKLRKYSWKYNYCRRRYKRKEGCGRNYEVKFNPIGAGGHFFQTVISSLKMGSGDLKFLHFSWFITNFQKIKKYGLFVFFCGDLEAGGTSYI